jgi:Flp pilus assembly protein TadD
MLVKNLEMLMKRSIIARLLALCLIAAGTSAGFSAPSLAVDTETTKDAPDLAAVRAKIKAKEFKEAIVELTALVDKGVQHADVYNLLGFSLRKSGDRKQAYTYYRKALEFDPSHKGALEYLGELYVETGDLPKAREHVAMLQKLCPQGCEELEDLEKAIKAGPPKTN